MAVTAVTITSGPTVVGRSVTLSGTLDRDGGGTNNNLNFLCYSVGYVAVYTITKLSDSSTFLNASGTAGSGIAWTWTGTLPEGDYLTVTVNLNEAPYTTLATTAGNVGLVELRKPLPGIWTPQRDSRGLFVPKANGVDSPISSTAGFISTRKFHYNYAVAGSNGIYTTVFDKILRRSDQTYGPVNLRSVNTPYGVGIDAQTGWQFGGYPTQSGGYNVSRQTWISLFYIYDAAKAITNYPRFFGGVGNNPAIRNQTISWNNPAGEQALVVTSDVGFSGPEVSINGVGNGLHCMVVTSVASTSAGSIRIFLDGQLVTTTTGPSGWNGGTFPTTDFYANSVSQSGLNIGNILFNAILYNYVAPDSEAQKLSLNPYSYFFRDAPKTSAKRRLFSGVLSLPDPPTTFKGGRFLPQRWKTQPQGNVKIDWSNPLTRDLFFAYLPGNPKNLAAARYQGERDLAIEFNGVNDYVIGPGGKVTNYQKIFSQQNLTATATSFTFGFPGQLNTSSLISSNAYLLADDPQYYIYLTISADAGTNSISVGSAITQQNYNSITSFSGPLSPDLLRQRTRFLSYKFKSSQVSTAFLGTTQIMSGSTVWDGTVAPDLNYLSRIVVEGTFTTNQPFATGGFGWTRDLSVNELGMLDENPWQLFAPNPGRLYFLPPSTTQFKGGRFLPQRWKQQPQSRVDMNWNHPIAQGLNRSIVITGAGAQNPARPKQLVKYSTRANAFAYSTQGVGLDGSSSEGHQAYLDADTSMAGAAKATYFVYGYTKDKYVYGGVSQQPILNHANQAITKTGYANGQSVSYIFTTSNFEYLGYDAVNVVSNYSKFSAAMTFTLGGTQYYYHQGKLVGTNAGTTTATLRYDEGYPLPFTLGGYNGLDSQIGLLWTRALSDAEIAALHENPWQIFKPNPGRIYFLPGATKRGKFLFLFS